jgi:hypothetical protein
MLSPGGYQGSRAENVALVQEFDRAFKAEVERQSRKLAAEIERQFLTDLFASDDHNTDA